ncbi:MAG: ImmA/IrrE family metallo-endopeptidase [Deltaproteobacteria bacterium]
MAQDNKPGSIPLHRQLYIDKMLMDFRKTFGIKTVPVDCVQLLREMKHAGSIKIRMKSTCHLPAGQLARTCYIPKCQLFLISISRSQFHNGRRSKYPFVYSLDRVLNYTIAHEIGHIALNHFELENRYKDSETLDLEELEADKFAECLLMPEHQLLSCSSMSKAEIAQHFTVTEQALLKRLGEVLHKTKHPIGFSFCHICGESKLNGDDECCRVCGEIFYPGEKHQTKCSNDDGLDNMDRSLYCPRYEIIDRGEACSHGNIYGFYLFNPYVDGLGRIEIVTESIYKYCSKCEPTATFKFGIPMKDWAPWDEQFKSKEMELNFYAPGQPIRAISKQHWDAFLSRLVRDKQEILIEALQGSSAKICGRTMLIFLSNTNVKNQIDKSNYLELLLTYLRDYIELMLNDEDTVTAMNNMAKTLAL